MNINLINCKKEYNLAEHTTLKIGGNAEVAYFPKIQEELKEIISFHKSKNEDISIIGAGSNLLVSSIGVKGPVIFTGGIDSCELTGDGLIKVGSGIKSALFSKFAYKYSLTGAEFLIGVPGLIGGAIYMNSGAHGQCIKDIIECADVLDIETGEIKTYCNEDLELDYRHSVIAGRKKIILGATFKLEEGNSQEIKDSMDFHVNYRAQRHPSLSEPNAGSTFRNPAEGVYVAKLLEDIGAKNWIEGGVRISPKHANFLYNFDNATSVDVSRLMLKMYNQVKEKYGYELIAELCYLGEKSEEEKEIWNHIQKH